MAPVPVSKPASSPNPSRGGETPGTRHASNEERRGERNGKSEKDREREREREKEREKEDPKHVGPWRIGKTIGKGSSGRVKIARHTITHQYAAVKIVPRPRPTSSANTDVKADKMLLGIEREIVIMKLVEHPNVLRLMDVWETEKELYLIMEYVEGGELFDYLVKRGKLHADEALHYFQQIISGVDYCHRFNICHRDLKPENLLLDGEKNIKIADFGMAALERDNKLLETSCGSPHYASPEIVSGLNYHGSSSDIWSCGIILFALLTGRLPFDDENIRHLLAKVKTGRFEMPADLPADAKNLINRMLEVDPKLRITMVEIQQHPWLTRKAPRAIHGAPPYVPPSIEQIDHPVASERDVDPDILSNLQTLWNGAEQDDIIRALLSDEKTWEKVFYTLLCKYRSRNLENFNMEDEEPRKVKKPIVKDRQHVVASGAIASRSRRSRQSLNNITVAAAGKRVKSSPGSGTPPLRPAPPIPGQNQNTRPVRPLPVAPVSPVPSRPTSRVPAIHLQGATPEGQPPSLGPWESAPPSPSPNAAAFEGSTAPVLPIQIPQTGDAVMQQFFHDIVGQLQTITLRNSLPASPLNSPSVAHQAAFFLPGAGGVVGDDLTQFEDAEEDESDAGHSYYPPGSPYPVEYSHQHQQQQQQYAYETPRQDTRSPVLQNQPPPLIRPRINTPGPRGSTREAATSVYRANSRTGGTISRPVSAASEQNDKENQRLRYSGNQSPNPTSMLSPRVAYDNRVNAGLGIERSGSDGFEIIDTPSKPLQHTLKNKRSKHFSLGTNPPTNGPSASPKQSWFNGLFNWKQLSYTLMSTENASVTRLVCKQMLEKVGVVVVVQNADGMSVLKCRVKELRDQDATTGPLKPVKFRVEFSTHKSLTMSPILGNQSPDGRSPYPTCLTLVMEKGAHSTFKAAYNRLRSSWELDSPGFPNANLAVRLIPSPLPSPSLAPKSPYFN